MRTTILAFLLLCATSRADYTYTSTFADTGALTGLDQYNNHTNGFYSGGQYFNNVYHPAYGGYATGFSVSSMRDNTTAGYLNQYSAITGGGNGDADYAILTPSAYVNLTGTVKSIDLTNTTYAYLSMLKGDSFNKQFIIGNYFDVVITGYSGANNLGASTGSVTVPLANYMNPLDHPLATWMTVDLTSLGSAQSLGFSFLSNATNDYGITVPEYVAVDNLVTTSAAIPEPSSGLLCLVGAGFVVAIRCRRLARIARV